MPPHDCFQDRRIERNENDIQDLWKESKGESRSREDAVRRVHKRIDVMQWAIVGAVFCLALNAVALIAQYNNEKSNDVQEKRIEEVLTKLEKKLPQGDSHERDRLYQPGD